MTARKLESYRLWANSMARLGFDNETAHSLRRIEMTLRRWHELECGGGYGAIERDEGDGLPYFRNAMTGRRWRVADREKGALKRLQAIAARFPALWFYVQGDPRGAALYTGTADNLCGAPVDAAYSRGTCCNY